MRGVKRGQSVGGGTRRRSSIGLRLGLSLGFLLVLGAMWAWSLHRQAANSPIYPPVPLASDKTLGINGDLSPYGAEAREQVLQAMQAAGFRWLRQRFPWDAIEPQPGAYDWAVWDAIVEGATQHNLELVAVLDGAPAWAQAPSDTFNPFAPPAEPRDLGAFAAAVASRYADRIAYYQIWDEPNIAPHWGAGEVDPAAYARLLREGAIQVRTADPDAVIVLAALAPNVEQGGSNMSDLLYLDALYQVGAAEWFDLVAAQPYLFEAPLDAPPTAETLDWRRPELLHRVMVAHGDAQTALWAVSFATCYPDLSEGACAGDPNGITSAVEMARREWPWLGPMLWAAWSPEDAHGRYSLTDKLGALNATYSQLRDLATAPAVAWPGVYPAEHPSGRYEGRWRVTPSGADIGQSGDRLQIRFQGTRLDLTVRRGDYRSFLFVSVDGQPANALPRDSAGRAYVVLYDPLYQVDTVTLARGLPDGQHIAELVAERGWGQWAIVGWAAARVEGAPVPWLAVGLASAAILSLLGTLLGNGVHRSPTALFSPDHGLATWACTVVSRVRAIDQRLALGIVGGAAILFWAAAGTLPSLLGLAVLTMLLVLWPEAGLPLVVLVLPFYQLGKPLLGKVFSMVEILTLLTAVGWLVYWALSQVHTAAVNRRRALRLSLTRLTAVDWGVIALLTLGAASLLWAEHVREAAREYRTVILEGVIFYGLLRCTVTGRRSLWRVADAWVLGGVLIALVGLVQWAWGWNLITAEGVWRVRGFYGSPNNLALYLGRVLPLGLAVGPIFAAEHSPPFPVRHWAYALGATIMGAAILLSSSRGAWLLGVPVSLLFLVAARRPRSGDRRVAPRLLVLSALALLLLLALSVVIIVGPGRIASLLEMERGTTFFRLQLWHSSLAMVRDHPLLGVGLDNFLYQYRTHYVLPTAWEEFNLSHPHNILLDFWLRLGILGLAVLAWLVVCFFRTAWSLYGNLSRRSSAMADGLAMAIDGDRCLVLGLMAGMVYILAHGLVDNSFFLVDLAFVFLLILALVQMQGLEASC